MKITATAALAALALLVAALGLAACSSDDDQSQPQQQQAQRVVAQQPSDEPQQAQPASRSEPQQSEPEPQAQAAAQQTAQQATQQSAQTAEQQQSSSAPDQRQQTQQQQADQAQTEDTLQEQQAAAQQAAAEQQSAEDTGQGESTQQQRGQEQQQAQQPEPEPEPDPEPAAQQQAQQTETPQAPPLPDWASPTAREAAGWSEAQLQARADQIAASASVTDLVGLNAWLNGAETTIARELARGNIVLIDFWTYTCVNCVRTFPFLKEWHAKYGDRGLTIIGVHSPEFEFEEEIENVRQSIEQYDIRYLVAQDNQFATWRAFNNRYWPAKYLIGPAMDIRYQHFGEGDYLETEHEIRAALLDAGWDLSGVEEGTVAVAPQRDPVSRGQTRELYGGTRRNYGRIQYAAQPEYYLQAGVDQFYTDIEGGPRAREDHRWYLQGLWRNEEEAIVHARTTENLEDYLAFKFTSRTVNVVLTVPENREPFNVYVELDGRWLTPQEAGADIVFDGDERSFVRVVRDDLYRLVVLPEWSTHELKLRSNSDQLAIFAFTFGSYLGGE